MNTIHYSVVKKGTNSRRQKVCLVSTHPLVLKEYEQLLSRNGFLPQVHQLTSPLLHNLPRLTLPPAPIYVVDEQGLMPGADVLVQSMLEHMPSARAMVLTNQLNEKNGFPLLRAGVRGLQTYEEARQDLPRALKVITKGGMWVPRTLLSVFVGSILSDLRPRFAANNPAGLSRREQEVLEALLENLANKEIANRLNISERTVKFHVSNLLGKFRVQRRHDLILAFLQGQATSPRSLELDTQAS